MQTIQTNEDSSTAQICVYRAFLDPEGICTKIEFKWVDKERMRSHFENVKVGDLTFFANYLPDAADVIHQRDDKEWGIYPYANNQCVIRCFPRDFVTHLEEYLQIILVGRNDFKCEKNEINHDNISNVRWKRIKRLLDSDWYHLLGKPVVGIKKIPGIVVGMKKDGNLLLERDYSIVVEDPKMVKPLKLATCNVPKEMWVVDSE